MNKTMEILLQAWGAEVIDPAVEASIRSPLGHVDEGGGGVGGFRCLSQVEVYAAMSRGAAAVQQALLDVVEQQGSVGRTLYQFADVRYARRPALAVTEQRRLLGISAKAYRVRLDALHVEVAARLPAVVQQIERAEAGTDAAKARALWLAKVRKAAKRDAAARAVMIKQGRGVAGRAA